MVAAQVPPPPKEGAERKPQPRLFTAERSRDLGVVHEGDVIDVTWTLENKGDADLMIAKTQVSCGCTVIDPALAGRTVKPGESVELKVKFNSTARRGEDTRPVIISSNDPLEPDYKLEFRAKVEPVYDLMPPGILDFRGVRRGEDAHKTMDFMPAAGRGALVIEAIESPEDSRFAFTHAPYDFENGRGERVTVGLRDSVALGEARETAVVRFRVGDLKREYQLLTRADIVGDLTWRPTVLDVTRVPSLPGKKFAPVTFDSPDRKPFEILKVDAGPHFDVEIESPQPGKPRSKWSVILALKDSAPPGPLATVAKVYTSILDQPVVEIPVFAMVGPPLEVEPPIVLFRQDGTEAGAVRRIKIQTSRPDIPLQITDMACNHADVKVELAADTRPTGRHMAHLVARYSGKLPSGTHEAVITIRTALKEAPMLTIPVRIDVP